MLDVAFGELPRRRAQEVLPGEVRPGEQKRQRVLQLIAEAERTARLGVARPRPDAAAQGLIEQPPVHHHVERIVRRLHLDPAQNLVPASESAIASDLGGGDRAMPGDESTSVRRVVALSEQDDEPARLARRELEVDRERRAGIEAGAEVSREVGQGERRRRGEGTVATQKRGAVAARPVRQLARRQEGHPPGELAAEGIPRQHPAGLAVELGDHLPVLVREGGPSAHSQ